MAFRVGVLVSGAGTNLQAILDSVHGRDGIEVVGVASSTPQAGGLERARAAGVESGVFEIAAHADRARRDRALGDWLEERRVDLVVLAGFMELLGPELIRRFQGRIINVHPSLLPAFPGVRSIQQAFDHGVKVTGVTIHFVDEEVDSGPVVLQEAIDLSYPSVIAEVEDRVHGVEHRLLPQAIRLIASGRVHLNPENPRQVRIEADDGDTRGQGG
ncbi:MAG: phosphoribosylglycinamide formyltransferase [Thermoleophilaceae bacterium]